MTRAVPGVAPWRAAGGSAALALAYVAGAGNAGVAETRMRVGAAVVAACVAFLVDDAAAVTVASSPTTLLGRRAIRAGAGLAVLGAWWVSAALLADAVAGSGRPPFSAALEALVIACIALAVSALAARRSDDATGGVAGAAVALACFATIYLPQRWWWPLTPDPSSPSGMRRLALVLTGAVVLGVATSLDPARRRRLTRRGYHQ